MKHVSRLALAGSLALFAASAGCSASNTMTSNPGDTAGAHLLAFASDRNQTTGQYDIYLYDLDLGGFREIAQISSSNITIPDRAPSISPNGRFIAFQSTRGATGSDILLYDRSVQSLITLPGVNTAANETEPKFSGDELHLTFTRQVGGVTRIRLLDAVGDTLLPMPGLDTTSTYSDLSASPNSNGSRIAFVSNRNGNDDIFVYDRSGDSLMNLPDLASPLIDVDPSLSADGRYLCFASNRAGGTGGFDLYLYDLTTKTFLPVPGTLNSTMDERHPSIGATAAAVGFQSNRPTSAGFNDVYVWVRGTSVVGQTTGMPSGGDDVDPALLWP